MVDKAALNDNRISLKAKGLLCYLLSKPPDWRPLIADICAHCCDKEESVRTALKQLAKFGYAKLFKDSGEGGRWEGSQWVIYESPATTEMAVSRISEKRHLKIVRMSTNKNEEIILREIVLKPLEGWKPPTEKQLLEQNENLISSLLVGHAEDKFIKQWRKRSEKTPWRTITALSQLAEDIAFEKAGFTKIKNRGGRANWWYLNCDKPSKKPFCPNPTTDTIGT